MKFKNISAALIFAILATLVFIFFNSRQIFFNQYEPEYFENWYYHSQWNYPQSTRGISDGPLYQFVGYRLVQGENPFNINFEMPPFGKYLYGLSAAYLNNPYWTTIFLYLGSFIVFFLLSKNLFKENKTALLALFLFVTTPFVATQLRETMLDLPLMFLYLVHVWLFIKYLSSPKLKLLALAGIFLGLATATKPGVYTPFVMLLGLPLVFATSKKILNLIFYVGSVFGGYVLAYFPVYFIRHPNPIPWLRLHEKALKFYLSPGQVGQVDYFNQLKGIFIRTYSAWWGGDQKIILSDWSLVLPLGVIATFIVLVLAIKRRDLKWLYISGVILVFLVVNTFIPFWPRYLMPVIPLFALLISFSLRRYGYIILLLALLNLPFLTNSLAPGNITGDAQASARFISTRAYRELYRSIVPQERNNLSEQSFIDLYETFLEQLGTRAVEVNLGDIVQTDMTASVKFKIKYLTKYGDLNYEPTFDFVKVHNQWKTVWKWDYLWPGFSPESKIVVNEKTMPFLKIETKNVTVAKRGKWKTVYIIPRLMFDWTKSLEAMAKITGESSMEIDRRIKMVIPDQYPRFVGYLDPILGQEGITKALAIPGVSLKDIEFAVITNDSLIPRQQISQQINILAKNQPQFFYVQAEAYLENNKGEKTVIPFKKIDQKDIVVQM